MWLLVLLVVILLVAAGAGHHASGSASTSNSASLSCTGSQTVTAHHGDNLTLLVETHVSGSYRTQSVVDKVVDMNGIADRDLIFANQQYQLPVNCNGH
jgi:hypothetical protein